MKSDGVKILTLGNYNIQSQAGSIEKILAQICMRFSVVASLNDDLIQELFDSKSMLYSTLNLAAVLIFVNPAVICGYSSTDYMQELGEAIAFSTSYVDIPFFIIWMPRAVGFSQDKSNALLHKIKHIPIVHFVDVAAIDSLIEDIFDPELSQLANVPYTNNCEIQVALLVLKAIRRELDVPFKVIVVDADNTLWAGLCAEKKLNEIVIADKYKSFQMFLLEMEQRGFIICLASKNLEVDVFNVVDNHPDMLIRRSNIAAWEVNWRSKVDNLVHLAERLNLPLNSFVFIDDREEECFAVACQLPDVLTIHFSRHGLSIEAIKQLWAFDGRPTQPTHFRTKFYQENQRRLLYQQNASTYRDFLHSLEIRINLVPYEQRFEKRIAELSYRTTQFNCVNRRINESLLSNYHNNDDRQSFIIRVCDKFGDYGISGFISLVNDKSTLLVDDFFISCRALGKGVEHEVLKKIATDFSGDSLKLNILFKATSRNQPAKDFLDEVCDKMIVEAGVQLYQLSVEQVKQMVFKVTELNREKRRIAQPKDQYQRVFTNQEIVALSAIEQSSRLVADNSLLVQVGASSNINEVLAKIWLAELGVGEKFFESSIFSLGASSLTAVKLAASINKHFSLHIGIKEIYENDTLEKIYKLIQGGHKRQIIPLSEQSKQILYAASINQVSLFMLDSLEPLWAYNMPSAFVISGSLDQGSLLQAFKYLLDIHPLLKSNIVQQDGNIYIKERQCADFSVKYIEMLASSEESLIDFCKQHEKQHFRLSDDFLIKVILVKVSLHKHVLFVNMHHVIADGWSEGILFAQLSQIYNSLVAGEPFSLADYQEENSYQVFCNKQNEFLSSLEMERQCSYWKEQLSGASYAGIEGDCYVSSSSSIFDGRYESFTLDMGVFNNLKSLALNQKTTLFNLVFAAFNIILSKFINHDDLLIGSPFWNRPFGLFDKTVGYFMNLVLLRTIIDPKESVSTFIDNVTQTILMAQLNQDVPSSIIAEKLNPDLSAQNFRGPKILFSYQAESVIDLNQLKVKRLYRGYDFSRLDLIVELTETVDGIVGGVYFSNSYSAALIESLIGAYLDLLNRLEVLLDSPVESISLVSNSDWSLPVNNIDLCVQAMSLPSMFYQQLKLNPNKIIVTAPDKQISYKELHDLSDIVAMNVQCKGYKAGDMLGVCLNRSTELVVTVLALAKLGIAYIGLDASHPDDYLAAIVSSSNLNAVITLSDQVNRLAAFSQVLALTELEIPLPGDVVAPFKEVDPHSILYVLYTSGTTGYPKGVLIQHAAFYNLLCALQDVFKLNNLDRTVLFHSFGFDVGQWEIWSSLVNSCELVIPSENTLRSPQAFCNFLINEKITVLCQTPSAFEHLCAAMMRFSIEGIPSLRLVVFTGELLGGNVVTRFPLFVDQQLDFFNMYGITEVTVYSTMKKVDLETPCQLNRIGKPIANTAILVLDDNLQPQPTGAIGELCLIGHGVAMGYLNNEVLTNEKFKYLPYLQTRVYRSGDVGRLLGDGEFEFLGRKDDQVKLRGYRIDLSDIEDTINCFDAVQNSIVLLTGTDSLKRIAAFITPDVNQAYPLFKIAQFKCEKPATKFHTLANELTIAHSNLFETETLYEEIFVNEEYTKHGVKLKDGDVVLDVGANIGMFSLRMAMSQLDLQIHAFEPILPIYDLLQMNVAIYNLSNVKTYNLGIYDCAKETEFVYYPRASVLSTAHSDKSAESKLMSAYINNKSEHSFSQNTVDALIENQLEKQVYTCKLVTISDVIEQNDLKKIDLLKVDVEKSEYYVLKGIDDRHWPLINQIVVEVHDFDNNLTLTAALLQAKKFTVKVLQNPGMSKTGLFMLFAFRGIQILENVNIQLKCKYKWTNPDAYLCEINNKLKSQLPTFMIPADLRLITEPPMTVNGKLDKDSLLRQNPLAADKSTWSQAGSELERVIYKEWEVLLKSNNFGFTDNFFQIGGNSLLLMSLFEKLENTLKGLDITDLFKYPTIRSLALAFDDPSMERAMQLSAVQEIANNDDVAIIGYAYKLPSIPDDSFFENLLAGKSAIRNFTKQELQAYGVAVSLIENSSFVPSCSFFNDVNLFDADFFNVLPADAKFMDPQHRVFMELAWDALEKAGCAPSKYQGDIGIACGVGTNHYYASTEFQDLTFTSQEVFSQKDYLATKIAYKLNLTGPAININTACSTGLVNVIKACQSLVLGEADIMLAGGVTLVLPGNVGYLYEEGGILSRNGVCAPFSQQANGTITGSGAVIFVLKKLVKAIEDNDKIHAVIKGYSINNDGNNKVSFAAPSVTGQEKCIKKAILHSNVKADDIVYLEAHGTGTKLGDSLELRALTGAYQQLTDKESFCCLGSVKANMGHTDAASGALGLLKAVMILENGIIPPQINCQNTIVNKKNHSPFYINSASITLKSSSRPPCAAISSLGIGGTNAHAIIQAAPEIQLHTKTVLLPNILTLSAKTPVALEQQRKNLLEWLEKIDITELDNVYLTSLSYTLQCGRTDHAHRAIYVVIDSSVKSLLAMPINYNSNSVHGDIEILAPKIREAALNWINGSSIDWLSFYSVQLPRKIKLPTYPFQRKEYTLSSSSSYHDANKELSITETSGSSASEVGCATSDKIKHRVIEIFCEVLGYNSLKLSDNFEKIGGDSLIAISILSSIEKEFNCQLTIDDIFVSKNIGEMVDKMLLTTCSNKASNHLICLKPGADQQAPVFMVHPGNGGVFHYHPLIEQLKTKRPLYGIENQIFNENYKPFDSIEEMALFYIKKIKVIQPQGPYALMGWSFGGMVAFEMARQLELAHEKISDVTLIDTWAMNNHLWSDDYFGWICENSFKQYDRQKKSLLLARFYDRRDLLVNYTPEPINAKVVLFKAKELDKEFTDIVEPENCWKPFVRGDLIVVPVSGGHLTMLDYPFVVELAMTYEQLLNKEHELV